MTSNGHDQTAEHVCLRVVAKVVQPDEPRMRRQEGAEDAALAGVVIAHGTNVYEQTFDGETFGGRHVRRIVAASAMSASSMNAAAYAKAAPGEAIV